MTTVNKYRQHFHLTPPPGFMNDIQSFFHDDEQWHVYYLWNGEHPKPAGSEWRHATTTDWRYFEDQGVAIPRSVPGLPDKDVATGAIVCDTQNLAGFGEDALLAYTTTFFDGRQRTNLWYSTDGGEAFTPYAGNPIQANELALADFRDPYVFIQNNKFYIYMAEKFKVGIYESENGKQFRYIGEVSADDLHHMGDGNPIECPCLLRALNVDGKPDQQKAVLLFSGRINDHNSLGTYYLVGHMEGPFFKAETAPKRLDCGPDFYGSRAEPSDSDNPAEAAYILGWMSNWSYTTQVPAESTYGSMSMCRSLTLSSQNGYTLINRPIMYDRHFRWAQRSHIFVAANKPRRIALYPGRAFALNMVFPVGTSGLSGFDINGQNWKITWRYDAATQRCLITRHCDEMDNSTVASDLAKQRFNAPCDIELPAYATNDGRAVRVSVFVDTTSVEFFMHDGQACTMSKFGIEGKESLMLFSAIDTRIQYQRRYLL